MQECGKNEENALPHSAHTFSDEVTPVAAALPLKQPPFDAPAVLVLSQVVVVLVTVARC